ncbi:Hypothetical protein GL50581_1797 [Giardia duodenalis ATCC 50581]|uniref:Uncharacterized protein n=1 Tax=Giardia intestinalis (strain ATCC 50581 / GS clone H7) TaxID=598745 RepID=C6LSQ6_GIAIB|nr:Hypothetical protein GL50581_1797 [Giardia intestinalis ATCC 50581]
MPKDAPAKSSKSMAGSLQLAKDYEDSGDIRRVRLPEDKLKDQFRLSFPERYLDRLTFDRSETFDKRLMQYRLSYLDSQSASKVNSTRRSHRTSSCSAINSKSPSIRSNSKVSTPTSKSPRKSLSKSQQKSVSRSSSKAKELDASQKYEKNAAPSLSPRGSKGDMEDQILVSQSPQRQEGLTPPASKQPSRQGSPKPHVTSSIATSASLPSTNSYLAYKKAIMQNATSAHGTGVKRPSSTRSNYNSLEYKQNLLLDHENDVHEKTLKQTNNHVVMDMLATNLAMAYVEDNCRDHKAFRSRHDIWEDQRDYVKPWRHNMKLEGNDADVEACIRKNIIVNEPVKALVSDSDHPGEKSVIDNYRIASEPPGSADLLKKYAKNDTQQLYDYSGEADNSGTMGRSREDGSFIKRYSIQTIQWNRQYNSIAGYKQELEEVARKEGVSDIVRRPSEYSPQQRRQSNSLPKPESLSEQLERYRAPNENKGLRDNDQGSKNHAMSSGATTYTLENPQSPRRYKPLEKRDASNTQISNRRSSTSLEPTPRSNSKAHESVRNNESNKNIEQKNPLAVAVTENLDTKSNRGLSKTMDRKRPQSARAKHAINMEKPVKLPSSSAAKEKRPASSRKDATKRAGSRQSQSRATADYNGYRPNSDALDVHTNAINGQSNTTLGASAPEVDIHKSFGSIATTFGSVTQQRHISRAEEGQSISRNTQPSPTGTSPQQTPSIAISEKSPEIREYTSHAQIRQQPLTDNSTTSLQQRVDIPTTLSPILFPHNLETTPHIRTSSGAQNEPHGRIFNDLAADLQELIANKKRKAGKLPTSIIDPKDMFPLSPTGTVRSSKDFSIDAFDKIPLRAADLNDSMPTALLSSPSRRMTEASNRNITKLYLNSAIHSPHAPVIDSSMLQDPKKTHAYAVPSQLLAIHDNGAEGDALAKSQELSLSQERSDLLSSAIQRTLGAQLGTSLPINEELQTQLYNALTKKVNI